MYLASNSFDSSYPFHEENGSKDHEYATAHPNATEVVVKVERMDEQLSVRSSIANTTLEGEQSCAENVT